MKAVQFRSSFFDLIQTTFLTI